jgi:Uma2 family endonuclease
MPVLIYDPLLEKEFRTERERSGLDKWDEVWEGVLVVPALPNNEHQIMVMDFCTAFCAVVNRGGGDRVLPGANVSDREKDWKENYRCPDVVVYLAGNPAKDCGTHWAGGPDLLVEIVSPGDDPQQKFDFYSLVNTREVLIVDRDPWALELYQLQAGMLRLAGRSDLANPAVLTSGVLPLTFQLRAGTPRPTIEIAHPAAGQTWTA